MRNNIIGFKLYDKELFMLDRPPKESYSVVRIVGEARNVKKLNYLIKHHESFSQEILEQLQLFYKEIN